MNDAGSPLLRPDDITTVATGETVTVIRGQLRGLGVDGRALLREALAEID